MSNKDCTNDTEIVLDQGKEVKYVYVEKIQKNRYSNLYKSTGEFVKNNNVKRQ